MLCEYQFIHVCSEKIVSAYFFEYVDFLIAALILSRTATDPESNMSHVDFEKSMKNQILNLQIKKRTISRSSHS